MNAGCLHRWIFRIVAEGDFETVSQCMQCVPESYTSVVGSRLGPQHWIEANRSLAGLVLPLSSVDAVLEVSEKDGFKSVSKDLGILVNGSNLGHKLFSWATHSIISGEIEEIVRVEIGSLAELSTITVGSVVESTSKAFEKLAKLPDSRAWMEKKREVTVAYGDWSVNMTASGAEEVIQMSVQAAIRHWAVSLELLTPLPAEKDLVAPAANLKVTAMDKELYTKAETARSTALKLLAGEEAAGMTAEIMLDNPKEKNKRTTHPNKVPIKISRCYSFTSSRLAVSGVSCEFSSQNKYLGTK
eukprot:960905-Amphidinium_carterae.2